LGVYVPNHEGIKEGHSKFIVMVRLLYLKMLNLITIYLNGTIILTFLIKRRVKQGYSFTPYLFLIVMGFMIGVVEYRGVLLLNG
jgi:hypothetical protein